MGVCTYHLNKKQRIMTTSITTKFKKSDDQTNIRKYRVAANITEYHITSKLIFLRKNHSKIYEDKNVGRNVKHFKMEVWTFWSQFSSCYALYIEHNYHTEFEIGRTILTYLN